MGSQKKSIRDFFSPVSRTNQQNRAPSQRHSEEINKHASQSTISTISKLSEQSSTGAGSQTPPTASNRSTSKTAITTARAMSTEAQPPSLSQISANSGATKRVVSNGEQVVLNSDSDSDSLLELDLGLGEPLRTSFNSTTPATRLKRTTYNDDDEDALRKPEKRGKSGKQSFNKFVQTAQQNMEMERKILERKADLDKLLEEPTIGHVTINEHTLGKVVVEDDDDDQKAHRLFLAMQRTNATQMDSIFYFFKDTSDLVPVQSNFPLSCLPQHRWTANLDNPNMRDQAFMTGFAHQIFRLQKLPEELASWMIDQICHDQDDVLITKYLEILASHHEYIAILLDKNRLHSMLEKIGGHVESLNDDNELVVSSAAESVRRPGLPRALKSIAKLLQAAAPWLQSKTQSDVLYVLCLICLDSRILTDPIVLNTLQDAVEAVICNFTDNNTLMVGVRSPSILQQLQILTSSQLSDVIPTILKRITHPLLQKNLICALPARSPLTAYLQRHLALAFLLHPTKEEISITDPKILALIHQCLDQSPGFQINKKTDYGHLAARLTLLDIAIGPGLLLVPHERLTSPPLPSASSSPTIPPPLISSEVKDFNSEIDALAQHVKLLGNSIVEAGAVLDLQILEAKDCVERLCSRLDHAVRIGGKKSHNVFDDDQEEKKKQEKVSKFFLKARKTSTPATTNSGIFEENDDIAIGLLKDPRI